MISVRPIFSVFVGVSLCAAQTINISGIVKNQAGVGIAGATVSLKNAGLSSTTAADGKFTLKGTASAIQQDPTRNSFLPNPIKLQNGRFVLSLNENAPVTISIHNIAGELVSNVTKNYTAGTHTLETPSHSGGIYLYRVAIGNEAYSFKSVPMGIIAAEPSPGLSGKTQPLLKAAQSAGIIADIISVVKAGQLTYSDSIKQTDTTGVTITMIPNAGNVTDADGYTYQSVKIGNQIWMVENLKTTKYNDGSSIPLVADEVAWGGLSTDGYCFWQNSSANQAKYGTLYNWYVIKTGKLAPAGWHVPSDAEWDSLQNYLIANAYNWDKSLTGNKIAKSITSKLDWDPCTGGAACIGTPGLNPSLNNSSGFSALAGSSRTRDGFFGHEISTTTFWWSATEASTNSAWNRSLSYDFPDLVRGSFRKQSGHFVRLVKN